MNPLFSTKNTKKNKISKIQKNQKKKGGNAALLNRFQNPDFETFKSQGIPVFDDLFELHSYLNENFTWNTK